MEEEKIRRMVRRVVYRTLGLPRATQKEHHRPLLTEADVRDLPFGGRLTIPRGALITPLAQQIALERRLSLEEEGSDPVHGNWSSARSGAASTATKAVAIGADHGGYELKEMLKDFVSELGYAVMDCGTDSTASVDYPDFAFAVARLVAQNHVWRGIIVDGAGIGSCMTANKVPGVRAAMCYDQATAQNSREHNGANVLTLGAGLIGPNLARQIVDTWLKTPSGGGRHAQRVDKIMEIEQRFLKMTPGEQA